MAITGDIHTYNGILTEEETFELNQIASILPFTPSQVYSPHNSTNYVKEQSRKSKTAHQDFLSSPKIKGIVNTILKKITVDGRVSAISIARNHVTFIRYDEGDFFAWHKDYMRYDTMSRTFEGHLLVCLEAPKSGGDLVIEDQTNRTQTYNYTTGSAILFDKSLKHQALPVTAGSKLIMSIDVNVVRLAPLCQYISAITDARRERKDVLVCDVDVLDYLAKEKACHKLPIILIMCLGEQTIAYDSSGMIGCDMHTYSKECAEICFENGIVDCREIMTTMCSDYPDEMTGWPLNLTHFAPYGKGLDFEKILSLPKIGQSQYFYASKEPEWCNEEYDRGYSVSFETYVYVPFSQLIL